MEKYHYVPPEEVHPQEQIFDNRNSYSDTWVGIDHMGRPKIDHVPDGDNQSLHQDNLSRFTGYYHGQYYIEGVAQ